MMTDCILTVYFEGTSNVIRRHTTQIGLFYDVTKAVDLSVDCPNTGVTQFKLGFDGCGITNGLSGAIFATGLTEQCQVVVNLIARNLLGKFRYITVNAIGLSRGGIAVLYLAKMIRKLEAPNIGMNLLLFDPVPGNLIYPSALDIFGFFTANKALDISSCANVATVLALYPYIALPDFAFHAPLFPKYPPGCVVEEDVCLGCHQGALFCARLTECRLSFVRIRDWLTQHGTILDIDGHAYASSLAMPYEQCVDCMGRELEALSGLLPASRSNHSTPPGAVIVRRQDPSCIYLNKWHQELICRLEGGSSESKYGAKMDCNAPPHYLLDIVRPRSNLLDACFSLRN